MISLSTFGLQVSRGPELLQESRDAVVGDLQHEATVDDAVPGRQVAVDLQRRVVQVTKTLERGTHTKKGVNNNKKK